MIGHRRSALVRGSFVLNLVFILYLLLHITPQQRFNLSRENDNLTQPTDQDYLEIEKSSSIISGVPEASYATIPVPSLQERVYPDLHSCKTPPLTHNPVLRGNYWVLYNYIPADTQPACNESITYTTHADITFLDNIIPLVESWRGPISIAVFAPGTDFNATILHIAFLRTCRSNVAKHVTFHLFFPAEHLPAVVPSRHSLLSLHPSCHQPPPFTSSLSYRRVHNFTYPVNIARNVARLASATYFVLASDIELFPSPNFIPRFLSMMQSPDASPNPTPARRVYVLPIFEIKSGLRPPTTKFALVRMLKKGAIIPFHKFVCPQCHIVPRLPEWVESNLTAENISVFTVSKRHPPFSRWEPIYVGTNSEPLYDERLSWEGRSDKMTQMYVMCVLDYEFHVLDTAFLVHRPGIKRARKDHRRDALTARQNALIHDSITPELQVIYGGKTSCFL